MTFVFHRWLAIPLWAITFVTVALTAPPPAALFLMPPTTLFVVAAVGIAAIVFSMLGAISWWGASRALVRVRPSGHRDRTSAAITVGAGTRVRTLDEPNRSDADALDLVRMDDDGGRQLPPTPA